MDPHDLERMLDRAERTGDTQLACAVYHEALERGITSLTEPYMEHYPDAKERYRRYAAAQRRTRRGVGERMFSKTEIPEPPEAFEHKRKRVGA
jgi:predicted amidohydrolase YtcJ